MKFQVPQFIDVEDKIVGPLTFKQFIYLAGGAGLAFLLYRFLPLLLALPLILPIVAFSLALAFYKVNNKPFIQIVEAAMRYSTNKKLYIWKKEDKEPIASKVTEKDDTTMYVPRLSDSKLRDIAWSLDVNDSGSNN
jgi:hypothetical protein